MLNRPVDLTLQSPFVRHPRLAFSSQQVCETSLQKGSLGRLPREIQCAAIRVQAAPRNYLNPRLFSCEEADAGLHVRQRIRH